MCIFRTTALEYAVPGGARLNQPSRNVNTSRAIYTLGLRITCTHRQPSCSCIVLQQPVLIPAAAAVPSTRDSGEVSRIWDYTCLGLYDSAT